MELIVLLFFGWCVTSILVNGLIFEDFRNYLIVKSPFFGKLFSCVSCLSVWTGAAILWPCFYFGVIAPIGLDKIPNWMYYFILPFIQSGSSVIAESFIIFLVKGTKK